MNPLWHPRTGSTAFLPQLAAATELLVIDLVAQHNPQADPEFTSYRDSHLTQPLLVQLVVPYGKEGVLADIRKNIHVLSESYEEKGVCLKINANPGTVTALKRRLAS